MSWSTFVAVGDSFTEGVGDVDPRTGAERGWADRVAEALAVRSPDLRYANLAVRGQLLDQIVAGQVERARAMAPDLVSLCAAGNDLLRPSARPADLAHRFEQAVVRLTEGGTAVLVFTGFNTRATPVVDLVGRRLATMNQHIRDIAERRGALLVDLWAMDTLTDPRARADDRLHLNAEGHRRVAARVLEVLGVPTDDDWRDPWPPLDPTPWVRRREEDLRWAREHLLPWVGRRVQGRSTGDGRPPKRPEPVPVR
ncbi:SGNH/GDSL hydrolase family protein [Actinomycetospora endophytica]|uniref:SGNH/GDSL hydrolase family protein n=1 Tax=Actinomycetospora endophytica TaxID=2291215 RepID=A0ABS8P787_9PSEU|nr:SGNH/GDSL hydrolase family protein [Actinomycetospora endophytica]MCD2194103.1 SGNH/GDSL hydrolase family protein [Actinomycetospora endophytica]